MADENAGNVSQVCKRRKLTEIDTIHDNNVSPDSPQEDPHEHVSIELNDDHYRFAYDLVEKVLDIRNELNPAVQPDLPEPQNYLFTEEHASIVQTHLYAHSDYLNTKMHQCMNSIHDFENYQECRNFFVSECKNGNYTEEAFIRACASIGYVAAHIIRFMNYYCGALDDAVFFIANWIRDILERGTIEHSSW